MDLPHGLRRYHLLGENGKRVRCGVEEKLWGQGSMKDLWDRILQLRVWKEQGLNSN